MLAHYLCNKVVRRDLPTCCGDIGCRVALVGEVQHDKHPARPQCSHGARDMPCDHGGAQPHDVWKTVNGQHQIQAAGRKLIKVLTGGVRQTHIGPNGAARSCLGQHTLRNV